MSAQSSVSLKPLGDRVVVRPLSDEESQKKSESGIIIPDTVSKDKNDEGVVVAAGPGRWDEDGEKRVPLEVKVGDRVLFKSWSDKVKVDGDEYWIISESDILAVVG